MLGTSRRSSVRTRLVCAAVFLIACGGDPDTTIEVVDVTPDHGSLVGGTRIVISGQGFVRAGAAPNRVLIGNREAPLAAAIDDNTLEVVTPPGDTAGDAPITVFNQNGQGKVMGI